MTISTLICCVGLSAALCATNFGADSLDVVSKPAQPTPRSFGDSGDMELSSDGKWTVFASSGNGIVTNRHNGFTVDIFLRNNETGEITLISGDNSVPGGLADSDSYGPRISGDGRYVVFESDASNLVAGDDNDSTDAFIYDRTTGELKLLSVDDEGYALQGSSGAPIISVDGQTVLIETDAALSPLDDNESFDLYRIRLYGEVDLVSAATGSLEPAIAGLPNSFVGMFEASMSSDGRFIAFISPAANHVTSGPTNVNSPQVYLRDMVAQTNVWLSRNTNGAGATFVSSPVVSSDGTFVLFLSSSILPTSQLPASSDIFLYRYDIPSGELRRIEFTANLDSVDSFALSDDGNFVSIAASKYQVYLHNFAGNTNILVSRDAAGEPVSGVSADTDISADGRYVLFLSTATNLPPAFTNELFQAYRFDRENGEIVLLSRATGTSSGTGANNDALFPVLSADGSTAAFMSYASNLATNDNSLANDVFIVSTTGTGSVTLASAPHPLSISSTATGQSYVEANAISLDGRFVIFTSEARDLVANDSNSARDLFVRDLKTNSTRLVSTRPDGNQYDSPVTFVGASLNGNRIAYTVTETLEGVPGTRLYVYDRETGVTVLGSVNTNGQPTVIVGPAIISPKGDQVFFQETVAGLAPLLIRDLIGGVTTAYGPYRPGPTTFNPEPFTVSPSGRYLITRWAVHDLHTRAYLTNFATTSRQPFTRNEEAIAVATGAPNRTDLALYSLDGTRRTVVIATNSQPIVVSLDGNVIVYYTQNMTNGLLNVYDVREGTSTPVTYEGNQVAVRARPNSAISSDGRFFAFTATNSYAGAPSNSFNKTYIYDTVLKTLRLVGLNSLGEPAEFGTGNPSLSANGRIAVFDTISGNLVPSDLNHMTDVFVKRFSPIDSDTNGLEDGWETINFGGISVDGEADADGDGISNLDEFRAGSDPNNASSTLSLAMEINGDPATLTISAPARAGMTYDLQHCTDLSAGDWQTIGHPSVAITTTVTFEVAVNATANRFFRIVAAE